MRALILLSVLGAAPASDPVGDDSEVDTSGPTMPPRILARTQEISDRFSRCYSRFARRTGHMGRLVVVATIAPDGKVAAIKLPPGTEPWQELTARCVLDKLPFQPAMRNGVAVASEAQLPLVFSLDGAEKVELPKVVTSEAQMERALRGCYPADSLTLATAHYRVTINPKGRATRIELVESTGDDRLDQAGSCVLESITFAPVKQGDRPISSTAIVPIALRPPK